MRINTQFLSKNNLYIVKLLSDISLVKRLIMRCLLFYFNV
jgi:hypothetical protein